MAYAGILTKKWSCMIPRQFAGERRLGTPTINLADGLNSNTPTIDELSARSPRRTTGTNIMSSHDILQDEVSIY